MKLNMKALTYSVKVALGVMPSFLIPTTLACSLMAFNSTKNPGFYWGYTLGKDGYYGAGFSEYCRRATMQLLWQMSLQKAKEPE